MENQFVQAINEECYISHILLIKHQLLAAQHCARLNTHRRKGQHELFQNIIIKSWELGMIHCCMDIRPNQDHLKKTADHKNHIQLLSSINFPLIHKPHFYNA